MMLIATAAALREFTRGLLFNLGGKLQPFVLELGQLLLKAVIFPQRGVELILIGIKLFARHQFHKLVIAGAFFIEFRLDLLELVAHALELFVERSTGLGLGTAGSSVAGSLRCRVDHRRGGRRRSSGSRFGTGRSKVFRIGGQNFGLPLLQQLQRDGVPVLLMCEPQAHSLFPLSRWQLCAPLDSVSAYDSYASVNSLINLLANAFLHETLDSGRPRIHDIATLYQQLDELEQR